MKTKDLIAALQEIDSTGEREVAVGNTDIHFVDVEPAYYDGCLQVLKRSGHTDRYDIIGGELRSSGDKVVIHTLSIRNALWNNSDFPVTYDADYSRQHYETKVEEWRKEVKDFEAREPRRRKTQRADQ